jgi:hypothetical protein
MQDIPPTRLLLVCAASDTCPDKGALHAYHLQHFVYEASDSNNTVLQQLKHETMLTTLAEEVQKGSSK